MKTDWNLTSDGLKREITFQTFTDLTAFLAKIGPVADAMNHHPDIEISKATKLAITLCSHDVGEVTERDHKLADTIDALLID